MTVMRTGPGATASNVNRPRRSVDCLEHLVADGQPHGEVAGRDELADDAPGGVVDDHDLDLHARRAERQLAGGVLAAHAGQLGGGVEHQLGQLLVDRPPRPRGPGPGEHAVRDRLGGAQRSAHQREQFVVGRRS